MPRLRIEQFHAQQKFERGEIERPDPSLIDYSNITPFKPVEDQTVAERQSYQAPPRRNLGDVTLNPIKRFTRTLADAPRDIIETGQNIAENFTNFTDKQREIQHRTFDEDDRRGGGTEKTQSEGSGILQTAGNVGRLITNTVGDVFTGVANVALTDDEEKLVTQGLEQAGGTIAENKTVQQAVQEYAQFKEENPIAAENIEGAVGLGGAVLEVVGAGPAVRTARRGLNATGEVIDNVTKKATDSLPSIRRPDINNPFSSNTEVVDLVRSIPNRADKIKQVTSGTSSVNQSGLLRRNTLNPTKRDIQISEVAKEIIDTRKNIPENIDSIRTEITRLGDDLVTNLRQVDTPFNTNQLRSFLSEAKEKSRVIFGGDASLERNYDAIIDEIFVHLNRKNLTGLLEARKRFDQVIENKFPRAFDGSATDNVRRNAINDVRRQVNEFIQKNAEDVNVRDSLRRQSLLFEARDNMAERFVRELLEKNILDRNQLVQFLKSPAGRALIPTTAIGAGTAGFLLGN